MVSQIALMGVEILFLLKNEKKIEADSRNKDNRQFPSHSLQKFISLLLPIVLWYAPKTCDRTLPRTVIPANNTFLNKTH